MEDNMSNLTSTLSGDASHVSSDNTSIYPQQHYFSHQDHDHHDQQQPPPRKKRSLPGNPEPDAEVIAMSPKSLLATNRFVCEICNKGFQRDQNLQLHRRGHNLPWKLKQRSNTDVIRKKVYVCPEISCVHHHPSRALGDLTGIKKHFCRKHGDKKWKCDKCSKRYAVQSDWKAHSKICGTREYRCNCGTLFSRRDSFITHRAFCDALAEETARSITTNSLISNPSTVALCGDPSSTSHFININLHRQQQALQFNSTLHNHDNNNNNNNNNPLHSFPLKREQHTLINLPPWLSYPPLSSSSSSSSSLVGPSPTLAIDQHHQHLMISSSHSPSPSSSSSLLFHHQDSHHHHHHHLKENSNPSSSSSSMVGPTSIDTSVGDGAYSSQVAAHMSATALLQKATEMGATMSKTAGVSSSATLQQHFQSHMTDTNSNAGLFGLKLPPFGDKATETTTTTGSVQEQFIGPSSSPSFIHDMMINPISSSSYDDQDDAFGIGGMLSSSKKDGSFETFHRTPGGQNNHNDGLTRDFLGLTPLSHNDILTIAGLGNCMSNNTITTTPPNPNSNYHLDQQDSHNNPWQG